MAAQASSTNALHEAQGANSAWSTPAPAHSWRISQKICRGRSELREEPRVPSAFVCDGLEPEYAHIVGAVIPNHSSFT